ncbi:MAG TPA: TonB-dependent receptor [Thermoanaerobaculia bacterium]|nr:TonB-dependent receptor [Thermoanaerobaculia bacterium]
MKYGAAVVAALLLGFAAYGQTDEKELEDLLSVVQQETRLATKTRMNSDYVPGIVTVLDGHDLEALGVTTAGEALGLIPGILYQRDRNGVPNVIVRGLDFPFNSGNIQIQLNGIPLVRADAGFNSAALLIPVEQIDRIEVIRGPGSVVYGDYAFMGLVNIITRNEGTRAFGRASSPHPTYTIGAQYVGAAAPSGTATAEGSGRHMNFAVNVAGVTSDDTELVTADVDDHRVFGVASATFGDLSFTAQHVQRNLQNRESEKSSAIEAKYAHANATVRASWLRNRIAEQNAAGRGSVAKIAADWTWKSWLIGADYSRSTIDEGFFRPPPPPGQPPGPLVQIVDDADRRIFGVTLQDRIDVGKALSLTLGARYDSYSDFEDRVTPRIAVVWRASDRHILKAQYTEGFRPPTFFELYSPVPPSRVPRYAFEVNATTELNYVFRAANSVGRATIFRSVISNMIRPGGVLTDPNARAEGVELEWSQQLAPSLKLDANVSYVDTIDPRQPGPGFPERSNPIASPWFGNLSLFYRPLAGLVLGARVSYGADPDLVEGRELADLTVSRELRRFSLRAGVKNIFDSDLRYYTVSPAGVPNASLFPGRTAFVQVSWRR